MYSYISISQTDKRTDYLGKEIAAKVQIIWDQDFDKKIEFVTGDEWKAGNLSYHLESRPKWEGFTNDESLNKSSQFMCDIFNVIGFLHWFLSTKKPLLLEIVL